MCHPYHGPYEIIQKISPIVYVVKDLTSNRKSQTVNIQRLKRFKRRQLDKETTSEQQTSLWQPTTIEPILENESAEETTNTSDEWLNTREEPELPFSPEKRTHGPTTSTPAQAATRPTKKLRENNATFQIGSPRVWRIDHPPTPETPSQKECLLCQEVNRRKSISDSLFMTQLPITILPLGRS